jgi:hypothetical protein
VWWMQATAPSHDISTNRRRKFRTLRPCSSANSRSVDDSDKEDALWSRFYKSDPGRVARFFLVQHTKKGKIYRMTIKYTRWPQHIPNGHKIYQMTIKYTNISHRKTL